MKLFSRRGMIGAAALGLAAVVVLAVWRGCSRRPVADSAARSISGSPAAADPSDDLAAARERDLETRSPDKNEATPATGTGEAYLAHQFRSFAAAQQVALGLNDQQVERLVGDLLEFAEIHAEIVARFAQETAVTADSVTVHVPPFPVEGKGVRDMLQQRLRTDFPDQAAVIIDQMGSFVDDAFRGFGLTDQTISIKKTDSPDTFEITWEATVPETQSARREAEGITFAGSSGVALFSRDQIKAGEYRFLAPTLDRHFSLGAAGGGR